MASAANVVVSMDAVRPSQVRVLYQRRATLRRALQEGTTKWLSPPPKMSWRTLLLVALLNSMCVVVCLLFIDWFNS